jgi:dipeptidase E
MLSSSRQADEAYLEHAVSAISTHLGSIRKVLFIPYAGVTLNWDDYTNKVQTALPQLNIQGIHTFSDPQQAVKDASAIMVGGGNTFHLLNELYNNHLIDSIQSQVAASVPYIGWSAGSNICGASIKTTNDMPVVEPPSFAALNLLACQINPHYTDYQPPGHNGETRDDRLAEFTCLNPKTPVLAIREGSALVYSQERLSLTGPHNGFCFIGDEKICLTPGPLDAAYFSEIN